MANWKTTRKRQRRNVWKRRGHTHIKIKRGNWTHTADEYGMFHHIPFNRQQPRGYRYYPNN